MSILTRQDLTRPFEPKIEQVDVPELQADGVVCVRNFSARERGKLEVLSTKAEKQKNYDELPTIRFLACALGMCDEQGNRLFQDNELDAIAALPAAVVDRISEKVFAINGLDKKKLEELEKNSKGGQAAASPST